MDLSAILRKYNKKNIIVIAGIIGIILIFISTLFNNQKTSDEKTSHSIENQQHYVAKLEQNIKNIISKIDGAGNCDVLVTIESDGEIVYATEERKNNQKAKDICDGKTTKVQKSGDSEKRYIKVKNKDGTEKALVVTEKKPKIRGVVVICDGGNDPKVQERITNAITIALNVTSNHVFVTKSSPQNEKNRHK